MWDNDCWSNEVVAWSHQRQIDTGMGIIAEANSSLKPDIWPRRMSGAVSGQALNVIMGSGSLEMNDRSETSH